MKKNNSPLLSRRRFVTGAASAIGFSSLPFAQYLLANPNSEKLIDLPHVLSGNEFDLSIDYQTVNYTGKKVLATTVNGSLPAPTLRWKEGERVTLRVKNNLNDMSSIHWHGIILPSTMDGSPGFDFNGIQPGETFEYQFDFKQSGTYWYHSHSGFQEQTGLLGAIIIDPKEPDPISYDRDFLILLSDWTDTAPEKIYSRLKKMSHYYNYRERTIADTWADIKTKGLAKTWNDRSMWNQMRMSDTDIADVTGYTYLTNGFTPDKNWTAMCSAGEKIRLRFINGAAMTIFDVRIPGLKMTVVAADGQAIQPVKVDEFRIGNAETYDVIVTPEENKAYAIFAQTVDRTGFACGTLITNPNLRPQIPTLDEAPVLSHQDMGMSTMNHTKHTAAASIDHSQHNMDKIDTTGSMTMAGMDHSTHDMNAMTNSHPTVVDHSGHDMSTMKTMDHSSHLTSTDTDTNISTNTTRVSPAANVAPAGLGNRSEAITLTHAKTEFGAHVDNRTDVARNGLTDPGVGLREHQQKYNRKVLCYADLRSLHPTRDKREPTREIELHLTGNMHRYMWSINGESFMQAAPIHLSYGERVRFRLVNDTMMTHPIHLHGMWSELETGDAHFIPRKHTILVQPGSTISYLVTADAKGNWAYHCHMLYHMFGMMRTVNVL